MFVLPRAQPGPLVSQAQVQAQLVELRVGSLKMLQPLRTATRIGFEDRLLKVQRRSQQALGDDKALALREMLALRQQPGQQVVGLGEDQQVFARLNAIRSSG